MPPGTLIRFSGSQRSVACVFELRPNPGQSGDVFVVERGYFGFLANIVTQSYPASSLITRRTLGWEPAQPGLLADLDNGHYFPAS